MGKAILVLAVIGVSIYAAIDCLRSAPSEVKGLPRPLWLFAIVAAPPFGAIGWLLLGRQTHGDEGPPSGGQRRPPVIAPDDDPDFLRSLDEKRRRTDP